MKWEEINNLTYVGNIVSIDGQDYLITKSLQFNIKAVQYHNINDFLTVEYEDGSFEKNSLEDFNYLLDEVEHSKFRNNPPTEYHVFDLDLGSFVIDNFLKLDYDKNNILNKLNEIDMKSVRALRENNQELIQQYENEAENLRVQLRALE